MVKVEARAGEHIQQLIQRMEELSRSKCSAVLSTHNGQTVTVDAQDPEYSADAVYQKWSDGLAASAKAYRESPAGQQAQREAEARALEAKIDTAEAMKLLPSGDDWRSEWKEWAGWLRRIIPVADHVESGYPKELVIQRLRAAGVLPNQLCGKPPESDEKMVGWILGQALAMAESGMPPHPALEKFVPKPKTVWVTVDQKIDVYPEQERKAMDSNNPSGLREHLARIYCVQRGIDESRAHEFMELF